MTKNHQKTNLLSSDPHWTHTNEEEEDQPTPQVPTDDQKPSEDQPTLQVSTDEKMFIYRFADAFDTDARHNIHRPNDKPGKFFIVTRLLGKERNTFSILFSADEKFSSYHYGQIRKSFIQNHPGALRDLKFEVRTPEDLDFPWEL